MSDAPANPPPPETPAPPPQGPPPPPGPFPPSPRPSPPRVSELRVFWLKLRLTLIILVVLIIVGVVLWFEIRVLLLGFAGVLLAIFLYTISDWLSRWSHMWYWLSLLVVCIVILAVLAGLGWLLANRIASQLHMLEIRLPEAWKTLTSYLEHNPVGAWLMNQVKVSVEGWKERPPEQHVISTGVTYISSFGLMLAEGLVVIFVGLFGAISPSLYVRGMLRLAPLRHRPRTREVLQALRLLLWWWIVGQAIAMAFIGVTTFLALWFLRIPLALTLGIIAAILNFIPNFGPILSVVPAAMLAFMQGPAAVIWVILVYIAIQALQNHVVTPVTMQKVVDLPASLLMLAQVFMWYWGGLLGVALAPPLAAVVIKLVQMLYLEDYLGDPMRRDRSFWPEGADGGPG